MREWLDDPSAWTQIGIRWPGSPEAAETRSGSVEVARGEDPVHAFVGTQGVPATGQTWAKVEFNPSRVLDPDGAGLAPVEDVMGLLEHVLDKVGASRLIVLPPEVETAKVKRLDVARDFSGIKHPDFYVRSLAPIKRPWAKRNLVHFDPQKRGAQTLMVGSGVGIVRLYNKHDEKPDKVPEGVLRWELEARADWAKRYGGVETVKDLSVEKISRLALDRWRWSQMSVEVSATNRVVEQVSESGLSPAKQRALLGWMLQRSCGQVSPVSKETGAEFNRLSRQLGVTLEAAGGDAPGFIGRLDWDSGREVVRAA